jgi:hypothetical protein
LVDDLGRPVDYVVVERTGVELDPDVLVSAEEVRLSRVAGDRENGVDGVEASLDERVPLVGDLVGAEEDGLLETAGDALDADVLSAAENV